MVTEYICSHLQLTEGENAGEGGLLLGKLLSDVRQELLHGLHPVGPCPVGWCQGVRDALNGTGNLTPYSCAMTGFGVEVPMCGGNIQGGNIQGGIKGR